MGSNIGKTKNETSVQTLNNECLGLINPDPRSPTPEITRTPLQNNSGGKHNITKNADLRNNFENGLTDEKLLHNNPILSAVIKNHLLSFDPRSPTQEFERTPIIIAKIDELAKDPLVQNENQGTTGSPRLDTSESDVNCDVEEYGTPETAVPRNLCHQFFDMALNDSMNDYEVPVEISIKTDSQNDSLNSSTDNNTRGNKRARGVHEIINVKSDNQINYLETDFDVTNVPVYMILEGDPRSPSTGIDRTPIVVAKDKEDLVDSNVEEMSDDNLIKVLQGKNAQLRERVHKNHEQSGDLLIYEDRSKNDTPKISKSVPGHSNGSRTPLSCMKNKGESSKSSIMLSDHKEKKVSKRVSHIPRLKALSKHYRVNNRDSSLSLKSLSQSLVNGDCENTPPHSHRDKWDKDNSIVV